jgi:signal transduction histidine kinase/ligand-binding sensor domain-containing protein
MQIGISAIVRFVIVVRLALVLNLLVGLSAPATAATADGILSGYSLTSWHDGVGRPLGSVYAIAQTDDGYLWLGADAGLLRFDGWRFSLWDSLSETRIPASVKTLTAARGGGLWVGSANPAGVGRLRDGKLQQYDDGLEGLEEVTALVEDGRGALWAIVDWDLYEWDGTRWLKTGLPWKTRAGQVRHVFVDRSGTLWVGTRWGVFEQIAGTAEFRLASDEHVWGIGEDRGGRIWTTDVAAGFRQLGAQRAPTHSLEAAGHRLLYDRLGTLWVGTFGDGLWRVHTDGPTASIERAALRTGLSSDSVLSIMEDRDGSVWVGTTVGLHRLTRRALTPLEDVGFVLTVLPWQPDGVLAGTTRGLVHLKPTPTGWQPEHIGSAAPEIRTFFRDRQGTLWIGSADGLWRLVGNEVVHQDLGTHSDMLVLSISEAPGGGLWLGDGQWVYRWNRGTPVPLELGEDAGFARVTFAHADRSQRLWLGSGTKIGIVEADGTLRVLGEAEGLDGRRNLTLYDVFEDSEGVLWLGTSEGLIRVTDGRLTSVGSTQGLPGNRVWSIVEDLAGDLWLTLDRGVVRVSRRDIAQAMANPSYRMPYQMYGPKDGLAGAPLGIINSAREPSGRLWFVRGGGATEVNPDDLMPRTRPPVIRIEEAIANDRRLDLNEHSLPAGTRRLEVSFTVLALAGSDSVRFRYRLDGFDTDWVDAGPRRTVFYTNLSPRDYRFRVEAHAEDGTWATSAADWGFTIQPAIYQTRWFYAFAALAIVACTVLAWRFRLALMRRQFSLALAERARLSREIHDTLLQSLVGVALQFDGIANALGPSSVGAREQLTRIRRQVEAYIREARQSIWDLRSPVLETHDLEAALRAFAKELIGDTPVRFTSAVVGSDVARPPKIDNQLLRIGQEAITNAVRHARARRIHLEITFSPDSVTLRVNDDGCGFEGDRNAVHGTDHYGLTTMKERAEESGGTFTISTGAGRGTSVEAVIPLSGAVRNSLPAAI